MKNRILSLILAMTLMIGILPTSVFAESDSSTCKDADGDKYCDTCGVIHFDDDITSGVSFYTFSSTGNANPVHQTTITKDSSAKNYYGVVASLAQDPAGSDNQVMKIVINGGKNNSNTSGFNTYGPYFNLEASESTENGDVHVVEYDFYAERFNKSGVRNFMELWAYDTNGKSARLQNGAKDGSTNGHTKTLSAVTGTSVVKNAFQVGVGSTQVESKNYALLDSHTWYRLRYVYDVSDGKISVSVSFDRGNTWYLACSAQTTTSISYDGADPTKIDHLALRWTHYGHGEIIYLDNISYKIVDSIDVPTKSGIDAVENCEKTSHTFDNGCDTECNSCGVTREVEHTYDNGCDSECNVCGNIREVAGHSYENGVCSSCGDVRMVTIGDSNFASIDDAIAAAGDNDVITLQADINYDNVLYLMNNAKIDLNGHTLTALGVSVFSDGGSIFDSSETKGLLAVPNGYLIMNGSENDMLPIWNEDGTGYLFVEVEAKNMMSAIDEDSFKIVFRPEFDSVNAADFFADGAPDNGITLSVQIKCIRDEQVVETLGFTAPESTIQSIYTNNKAMSLTVNGAGTNFDSYEIAILLTSDTGVVFSQVIGSFSQGIYTPVA